MKFEYLQNFLKKFKYDNIFTIFETYSTICIAVRNDFLPHYSKCINLYCRAFLFNSIFLKIPKFDADEITFVQYFIDDAEVLHHSDRHCRNDICIIENIIIETARIARQLYVITAKEIEKVNFIINKLDSLSNNDIFDVQHYYGMIIVHYNRVKDDTPVFTFYNINDCKYIKINYQKQHQYFKITENNIDKLIQNAIDNYSILINDIKTYEKNKLIADISSI